MVLATKSASRWYSFIIFGVMLTCLMVQTKTIHESWNESSRLAAIQSLVEHGTWQIDASPYGHETGDKMVLNGHYYSEKPPLFAAIGAIFYAMLHYGLGATLAINGCQPGALCVYYWLTVLMVGIPSALMAALFYRLALQQVDSIGWAIGLTALLCFGTVVWPYSLVFNHHLPAASALFSAFYLLFNNKQNPYQIFLIGLLLGTAVMLDLTSVFLAFVLLVMVVLYNRRHIFVLLSAALIPVILTGIFNYQITGTVLLSYFAPQGYNYPGSPWDTTIGGQHPPDNILLYTFQSLIGDHGLFGYSPLLLFALIGLIHAASKNHIPQLVNHISLKSVLILLGIIGHLLFILTQTNHFGGDAYGWRFLIPFIPTLYFFIVFVIPASFYKSGGRWVAVLWSMAALVSLFSAYQGVKSTWHQVNPPFFAVPLAGAPYFTIQTNLNLPNPPPTARNNSRVHNFEVPEMSHRLDLNFNDELMLLGYDLPLRRVQPGQSLEMTLYWQSLRVAQGDYFVFTHLLDAAQTRQGGLDRRLQEGYPLKFWYPGEVVADHRQILVNPHAANGLVWLRIGIYQMKEGSVKPLPILMANGIKETSIAVGPVLVGVSPQAFSRAPQTSLAVPLGQPPVILLRGYDLAQAADNLHLTLYWESLAPTPTDWTFFVHLRNETGETVAQKDGPLGGGLYPTSLWVAGEMVADDLMLSTAHLSEAEYSLFVGVYDLASGERLAVPNNPAGEIKLTKIRTLN